MAVSVPWKATVAPFAVSATLTVAAVTAWKVAPADCVIVSPARPVPPPRAPLAVTVPVAPVFTVSVPAPSTVSLMRMLFPAGEPLALVVSMERLRALRSTAPESVTRPAAVVIVVVSPALPPVSWSGFAAAPPFTVKPPVTV